MSLIEEEPIPEVLVAPRRAPGPLAPLRRRNFTLLFIGQIVSAIGDQAYSLALPWTVLAVTGDPRQMAIVLAAAGVSRVALLLVGGALADRLSPRLIMLLADSGRVGVVGVLGVTLFGGLPALWIVSLLAAFEGAGSGLFQPGMQALIPATVPEEELPAGNGLMQTVQYLTLTVGPIFGGVATAAQASIAFLLDAFSFAISALALFGIRLPARAKQAAETGADGTPIKRSSMFSEIRDGWRYGLGSPFLRIAMTVTIFGNFAFSGAMGVALVVLARALSPTPITLGLIVAAAGVGGIAGGLGSAFLGRLPRRGVAALILWAGAGLLLAAVPILAGPAGGISFGPVLSTEWHIAAVAIAFAGIGLTVGLADTMFVTIMQQRTAPEYLARVFSILFLAGGISQPLSLVLAGVAAAAFGPGAVFFAAGACFCLAVLIGAISPVLRNM